MFVYLFSFSNDDDDDCARIQVCVCIYTLLTICSYHCHLEEHESFDHQLILINRHRLLNIIFYGKKIIQD